MRAVRRVAALLAFAGLFWAAWRFVQDNQAPVPIDLPGLRTLLVPIWGALLGAFATGVALAALALLVPLARSRLVARRYRREVGGLEAEIHQLRNLPLAAEGETAGASEFDRRANGRLDRGA
jgi:uncharacterized integral membrane protein